MSGIPAKKKKNRQQRERPLDGDIFLTLTPPARSSCRLANCWEFLKLGSTSRSCLQETQSPVERQRKNRTSSLVPLSRTSAPLTISPVPFFVIPIGVRQFSNFTNTTVLPFPLLSALQPASSLLARFGRTTLHSLSHSIPLRSSSPQLQCLRRDSSTSAPSTFLLEFSSPRLVALH